MTRTTKNYESLHCLTPAQTIAVNTLAAGATQREAAEAAGVHRVTVTRWLAYHPELIAELNRLRADAAAEAHAQVVKVTKAALAAIEGAVVAGDVEAAFRWLRIVPPTELTTPPSGPFESRDVIERVRRGLPTPVMQVMAHCDHQSTDDALRLIVERLNQTSE